MTTPVNPNLAVAVAADPAAHGPAHESAFTAAALRATPDVDDVPDSEVEKVTRDIGKVAVTVLGVMRVIPPYVPQLATMPGLDMVRVQKLGDYAVALMYWHASTTFAAPPKPELIAMLERAIVLRQRTLHDLGALVRHELLAPVLIEEFGSGNSYLKVAHDLFGLSNLVYERWADIGGHTLTTLEAMDEATTLALNIIQCIGDRDVSKGETAQAVVRRNKAFRLVTRTYGELRDAMIYLRRAERDVDNIVPSLFTFHRTPKKAGAAGKSGGVHATSAIAGADVRVPQHSSIIVPDDAVDAGD